MRILAPSPLYCLLRESASRHQFHLLASSTFGGQADTRILAPLLEGWEEVQPAARPSGPLPRLLTSVRRRLSSTPRLVAGLLPLRNHAQELIRRALTTFRPDLLQVEHTITLPLLEGIQGEEALLSDTPQEFSQAVNSLLTDEALRGRLAERGRRLVEERFSWAVLAPAMERAYEECVALHA